MYNYLKTEIGPSFKIPLAKITDITIEDTTVELLFLNNENTIEIYLIIVHGHTFVFLCIIYSRKLKISLVVFIFYS